MTLQKGRTHIYVPRGLVTDSQWPFGKSERVRMILDVKHKRLIVEKI